jgi:hypothetical protein
MRWGVFVFFVLLSLYLLNQSFYNAWASIPGVTPPGDDMEAFKTRAYFLLTGSFVVLELGINIFLWMSKNKQKR